MSAEPRGDIFAQFRSAFYTAVERFDVMDEADFLRACIAIAHEQDGDFDPDSTELGDILFTRAQAGSIEAAAALMVMGAEARAVAALEAIAARSPDLTRSCQVEALVVLLEEHCEDEVKAGRMRMIIDGPSGKKLYQEIPPDEREQRELF